MVIDTHAHLTDDSLSGDLERFLAEAEQAGVTAVLTVGTTLESSRQAVAMAERYPAIRAAVGLHPNNCCQAADGDWAAIEQLCRHPRVAALGETGLDRYWDDCPWEVQVDYFRRHLALSRETGLPVVIHTRDCAEETADLLELVAVDGPLKGVMHSFTAGWPVAERCLATGLYISFAGMLTFKNAAEIREVAAKIPLDRLLVETDSPYLTPHPHRGQRPNHPALVVHTLRCLADVRRVAYEQLAAETTKNAEHLFGSW
jgi:TatD DNase family protein